MTTNTRSGYTRAEHLHDIQKEDYRNMPDKPKDSKDGLGASIAGDFDGPDDDQDDARTSGDDTGSKDGDGEDGDGGSDDSKRGKPEGKKDEKDEKDGKKGEGDDDGKVTLTKDELEELIEKASTKAVSAAVASVNSTKDKQLRDQAKKSAEERESILRTQEEGRLSALTGDDRARMQSTIDTDRLKREADQTKADATEMYRVAKVERSLASHARFGVTEEQLQKCESEAEMLQICSDAERQYWQDIATGKRRPDDDDQNQRRQGKRDKPEGSQRKTNIGGGGSGGGSDDNKGQATTLDGFGRGLVEGGVVPGGGIKRGA